MGLKWLDTEEIAAELKKTFPLVDPAKITFVEIHSLVVSLPDFDDRPKNSSAGLLESIQKIWAEI